MNHYAETLDDVDAQALLALPERPFTTTEARSVGVDFPRLRGLVARGQLRHPVRRVYVPSALDDDLASRVAVLRLVVPADCVVTDRTAAWLWGASMALAPGAHLDVPRISVFAPPGGRRLRNELCASGERALAGRDVKELHGLLVTTPLRTACDAARLLHRYAAIGVLDTLARLELFAVDDVAQEMERFKGYRGVVQGRDLSGKIDPGADSDPESALRLHWRDVGLPEPATQVPVPAPGGGWYYLDVGSASTMLAAEYDGADFHGPEQEEHDTARRSWSTSLGWRIVVVRRENLYGRTQDVDRLLHEAHRDVLAQRVRHKTEADPALT